MSLIAWYKFDGNGNDSIGKNNLTFTSTGSYGIGKIGNAFTGNGSSGAISMQPSASNMNFNTNVWSISLWVKPNLAAWIATPDRYSIFDIGSYYIAGETDIFLSKHDGGSGRTIHLIWYSNQTENNSGFSQTFTDAELGDWIYFAITCDGVNLTMNSYCCQSTTWRTNGIAITYNTQTRPIQDNLYLGGYGWATNNWRGGIDDVKIYDHALSTKEIKELAKAKVLHYTFNDFQEPTTNLLYNSGAINLTTGTDIYGNATKTDLGNGKYKFVNNGAGGTTVRIYCNLADLTNAETYGCSVYYDLLIGSLSFDWCDTVITGINSVSNSSGRLYGTSARATYDSTFRFLDINLSTSGSVILYNPQIEHKDHVTPFIDGSRNGTIRDISGYNNSAVLAEATTPKWTTGKLGCGGYTFSNAANNRITTNTNNYILDNYTISFWMNRNIEGKMPISEAGSTSFYWYGDSSWKYSHGGVNGEYYYNHNASIPTGTWGHFCAIYNGANVSIYRNGVYEGSQATTGTANFTSGFIIGNWNSGSSYAFDGIIDDVRVYATALSASDVLELYQTRAALDSTGNLLLNEVNTNGFKPSLIDYTTWVVGSSGSQTGFSQNGETAANTIITKPNPVGDLDVVWASLGNDASSDADGGWNGDGFAIDKTKTYRYSMWVRKENAGNGRMYFGCQYVDDLGTTINHDNPYFGYPVISDLPEIVDNWVLFVAFIHNNTYAGGTSPLSGIYTQKGVKTSYTFTDYKWSSSSTIGVLRAYQFYSTSINERQYWYRPRVDVVDGNEPSIAQLLSCSEHRPLINSSGTTVWNLKNIADNGSGNFTNVSEVGITDGLVGWWKLNGDARDYSGNSYHGTVTDAVVSSGLKGLSYNFNGSGQYITTNTKLPELSTTFSVSCWVYPNSTQVANTDIYGCHGGYYTGFALQGIGAVNNYSFVLGTGSSWGTWTYLNVQLSANIWQFVTIVKTGTNVYAYLGDTLIDTESLVANLVTSTNMNFSIGKGYESTGREFNGKIADVRIYNRALSADEVLILYKQGSLLTGMQLASDGSLYLNNEIKEGF